MTPIATMAGGGAWHFDWRSALIGFAAGWLLLIVLYRQREGLRAAAERLLAPLAALKRRLQSSAEEKYRQALRRQMRRYLLFRPSQPEQIVRPPLLQAEGPLPTTLADAERAAESLTLPLSALLRGHPRLLLSGEEGAGRTAALIALALHVLDREDGPFPLWLDLRFFPTTEEGASMPVAQMLGEVAARSVPQASRSLLQQAVERGQLLVLVDGWDNLAEDVRPWVAARLAEGAEALPEARWIVAVSPKGCGWLTERGFVPLTPLPPSMADVRQLYAAWAARFEQEASLPLDLEALLRWALASGDGYLPLTLRLLLHFRYNERPDRLADVLLAWRDYLLPLPEGEEVERLEEIQRLAWAFVEHLAYHERVEGMPITAAYFRETLASLVPAEAEHAAQLAERVKRLVDRAHLLVKEGRTVRFAHFAWADLFAALALARREEILPLVHHIDDPAWAFLLECFVALGQADELVRMLLKRALQEEDVATLLRVSRWAALAPEAVDWRKPVLMALARFFTTSALAPAQRLAVGKALALVAGEEARPFYLKALRHPLRDVQVAALRGLGWTGTVQDMHILAAAVKDAREPIRVAAVRALGDLGTGGALRLLRELLYGSDEALMLVIAETLAESPDGWEILQEASRDEDLLVRRAAAHGLGRVPEAWAELRLTKMAREDGEWLVRSAADAALAARQQQGAVKAEVPSPPRVDELPWLINWAARQGLGVGVGEEAYTALLHALEHGEPEAQILAARTLTRIGREQDVDLLRDVLGQAEDEAVRRALREALTQLESCYGLEREVLRLQ